MSQEKEVLRYKRLVQAMARAYSKSSNLDAEDLRQEAYIAILRALNKENCPKEEAEQLKFVRCCIVHSFIDYARKESQGVDLFSMDEEIGHDDEGEPFTRHDVLGDPPAIEQDEEKRRAFEAVLALPPREQEVIRLRLEELSWTEIGELTGLSADSAAHVWHRALVKLKQLGSKKGCLTSPLSTSRAA